MRFQFLPESASTFANDVDPLWWFIVTVTIVMTSLIFLAVFLFAMKYRRRREGERTAYIHGSLKLEIIWSVIPLMVMMVMFFWGARLYFDYYTPPPDALDVYLTGKQWMWKVQYPEGQREINEIHVPVGRAVKLTMASEDVIHSLFIPAFRLKRDVVPGHFNVAWFRATKPGRYHLYCAEYCGTQHSGMIGWVNVMEPSEYENWLAGGGATGSMASQGQRMFQQFGCSSCHLLEEQGRGPNLRNVYGNPVRLDDGRVVTADDAYIRESILNPNAKIVAGFKSNIMPTFQGQVTEEALLQLIAYLRSLSPPASRTGAAGAGATGQTSGPARVGGTPGRDALGGGGGAAGAGQRPQNQNQD